MSRSHKRWKKRGCNQYIIDNSSAFQDWIKFSKNKQSALLGSLDWPWWAPQSCLMRSYEALIMALSIMLQLLWCHGMAIVIILFRAGSPTFLYTSQISNNRLWNRPWVGFVRQKEAEEDAIFCLIEDGIPSPFFCLMNLTEAAS
jgi:hypothetical protein